MKSKIKKRTTKPYPLGLRKKAVKAYLKGEGSLAEIAKRFGFAESTLCNYLLLYETGDLAPKLHYKHGPPPVIDEKGLKTVTMLMKKRPDSTLNQLCAAYHKIHGKKIHTSVMLRALKKLGLRLLRSKKSLYRKKRK